MDLNFPYRDSIRMSGFNYGQTCAYFVSLVVLDRQPFFGRIVQAVVKLSDIGEIVKQEWLRTPSARPGVFLDEWVIMPNHFQAIIFMDAEIHGDMGFVGAHRCAPGSSLHRERRTLGSFIAQFKATTTRLINERRATPQQKVWQRNYHDRIIRNEVELDKIRKYIRNNPRNAF